MHRDHIASAAGSKAEAEAEDAGTTACPPPLPWHRRRHHGLVLLRWWYGQVARVFRAPDQRLGSANTTCVLAPLEGLCPGVLRLRDLFAGAWNGWWHTLHERVNGPVWLSAVQGPSGPDFGTKGATIAHALPWRYPCVLCARTPLPNDRSARLFYTWGWYLALLWWEETGAPMWRPTRHGRMECWDPPNCWHFSPRRRLALFASPPPPPTLTPRRPSGRWLPRCTPSFPGSPTSGGPPCRSRATFGPPPSG